MKGFNKDYYFQRGVQDATRGNTQRRKYWFMVGTWQALAYKAGYDSIAQFTV